MSLIDKNPLMWQRTYPIGDPLTYTPDAANSIANIAQREGRNPHEVVYDRMLERDGRPFLLYNAAGQSGRIARDVV